MISRVKLSLDAIRFLESVATSDADPATRARAIRGLVRHSGQQEARESALRALATISLQDDPPADLLGAWLDFAKDGRNARDPASFVKLAEGADVGQGILGYAVLTQVAIHRKGPSGPRVEAERAIDAAWKEPALAARLLRAIALAKVADYAPRVEQALTDASSPPYRQAAEFAARRLNIAAKAEASALPTKGAQPDRRDAVRRGARRRPEGQG